jgi:hypothetical protein
MLLVHVVDDEPDVEVLFRQQFPAPAAQEGRVKDNPLGCQPIAPLPLVAQSGHLKRSNNVRFRG